MRNILRHPGAEVLVGLLGFFASFVAIGLALAGLSSEGALSIWYSYGAFGFAGLLFFLALMSAASLAGDIAKTKGHTRQIGRYIKQGSKLRLELLEIGSTHDWTMETQKKFPQWEKEVQEWLDRNLPDYASDLGLETVMGTSSAITYDGVEAQACSDALHLESRLANLRGILREIRR